MTSAPAEVVDAIVARTSQLSAIPAPPCHEAERSATVAGWWEVDGLDRVHLDDAGNVWAQARTGPGGALVLAAHLDTVFPPEVPHGATIDGDRMRGPGVGDNTVAVAALSAATGLAGDGAGGRSVWIVGTVGEEGLGDLFGIRHALAQPPERIAALIAVEGSYFGRIATTGVGSVRYRIRLDGPGGHAWEDRDEVSCVDAVASLAQAIGVLRRSGDDEVAVNVGKVWGGEAINARARTAGMEVDLRATSADALTRLSTGVSTAVAALPPSIQADVTEIGNRPAGGIDPDAPLVRAAVSTLRGAGIEPKLTAASTDANAAYAAGVAAVTVGVTTGGGEHTPGEWIDLAPLAAGVGTLASLIDRCREEC